MTGVGTPCKASDQGDVRGLRTLEGTSSIQSCTNKKIAAREVAGPCKLENEFTTLGETGVNNVARCHESLEHYPGRARTTRSHQLGSDKPTTTL